MVQDARVRWPVVKKDTMRKFERFDSRLRQSRKLWLLDILPNARASATG